MSEENIVEDQNVEGAENSETPNFTQEEEGGENSKTSNFPQEEDGHAATVEALQQRLLTALVKADGRMQDPTDFPFNAEHLDNEEALLEAITELLEAKPHLKKRTNHVTEDIGAGVRGDKPNDFDLLSVIRSMQ